MAKETRKFVAIGPDEVDMWELLAKVREDHPDTTDAQIGLGWLLGDPKSRGRIVLGRMMLHSEKIRVQTGLDATIGLNMTAWAELSDRQREALIDHEMRHLSPSLDKEGDQREDGHGNLKWKIRGHDIEEFRGTVERYGLYLDDLAAFAETCIAKRAAPLYADQVAEAASIPRPFPISDQDAEMAVEKAVKKFQKAMKETVSGSSISRVTISCPETGEVLYEETAADA